MKKVMVMLSMSMLACFTVQAQSAKYLKAMENNLRMLDVAKSPQDLTNVSAAFERIAEAEKTQWLPYYYAALAQARLGFMDPGADKDATGEKVAALAAKAQAIDNNAEIYVLRNMAATLQLLVNPQQRWSAYGKEASEAIETGLKLDPNNPRLYYLKGMALFNQPAFIGGGKDKAKPYFEKALPLFGLENKGPLYPDWGKKDTEYYLQKCQ